MEILRLEIDQICLGRHTRETPRHFPELFEATLSAFLLWRTATSMPYSFAFNGKRRTRNALAAADCQRATYRDRSRYHAAAVLLARHILGDEIPVDELLHESLHEIGRRF
jgi:hypothetical protein